MPDLMLASHLADHGIQGLLKAADAHGQVRTRWLAPFGAEAPLPHQDWARDVLCTEMATQLLQEHPRRLLTLSVGLPDRGPALAPHAVTTHYLADGANPHSVICTISLNGLLGLPNQAPAEELAHFGTFMHWLASVHRQHTTRNAYGDRVSGPQLAAFPEGSQVRLGWDKGRLLNPAQWAPLQAELDRWLAQPLLAHWSAIVVRAMAIVGRDVPLGIGPGTLFNRAERQTLGAPPTLIQRATDAWHRRVRI